MMLKKLQEKPENKSPKDHKCPVCGEFVDGDPIYCSTDDGGCGWQEPPKCRECYEFTLWTNFGECLAVCINPDCEKFGEETFFQDGGY